MITVNDKAALKMYSNAIAAINDFTPALKSTRKMQLNQIEEAFKVSGKNIIGQPWERLKPSTIKQKLASGYLTNILVRTEKLRKSFKSIKQNRIQLQITSVGVPYFEQHQLGDKSKNLPRRQILGHSPKMIKDTLEIFRKYIIKKITNG